MNRLQLRSLAALSIAFGACTSPMESFGCTANEVPAIVVSVIDSVTRASRLDSASVVATAPGFVEALTTPFGLDSLHRPASVQGVWERAGTYAVSVRRVGYGDWAAANLVVSRSTCHVSTVTITALIQPLP